MVRAAPVTRRLWGWAVLALLVASAPAQTLRAPSPQTGIGVWYVPDAPRTSQLWRPGDGQRLALHGRLLSRRGQPIANARVELWHGDANGQVHPDRFRATLTSGRDGSFRLSTVYPGYVWGPRHIHVVVTHPEYERFVSRMFFNRDPRVAEVEGHDLAIFLEDAEVRGEPILLGRIELVLVRLQGRL